MSLNNKANPVNSKTEPETHIRHATGDDDALARNTAGEVDPANLQVQDIDDQQIPYYIESLEEHRKLYEREGRYIDAEKAKKKIQELQDQLENNRREEIKAKHLNEKLQLEEAHVAEFNQFNEFWDKKMEEFNLQVQAVVDQLVAKHQEDLPKYLEELDNQLPNKPKESAQLLNLRKIQENLARQKDYIEAHKVQMKCAQLEKDQNEKWAQSRDTKIRQLRMQFETKQENELKALRKRISTGQEEQRKARALELERLIQKYQNVKKELEYQQQLELLRLGKPGRANSTAGSLFRTQGSRFGRTSENFKKGDLAGTARKRYFQEIDLMFEASNHSKTSSLRTIFIEEVKTFCKSMRYLYILSK